MLQLQFARMTLFSILFGILFEQWFGNWFVKVFVDRLSTVVGLYGCERLVGSDDKIGWHWR